MKQSDLALKWYRPCELQALASWLPWAALVNLLVLGGESLRDDGFGIGITAAGPIALALARIALPDGAHGFKLLACLGCVLSALLLGLVSLAETHGSVYDLWARAWLVVPAAAKSPCSPSWSYKCFPASSFLSPTSW